MVDKTFLTIDSGGSKTKLSLYGLDGKLIKENTTKGFGLAQDGDEELIELSQSLLEFCFGREVLAVVCNLGGKNKNQVLKSIKTAQPTAKVKLFRESEGVVGRELCKKFNAEVCLMSGTGSIAIAPVGENVAIIGGWGANISDKGSGYELGLDAIKLALEEIDGTSQLSLLTKTLIGVDVPPSLMTADKYCEFRDQVRKKLFPLERSHIASFAKTVYLCAKQGDEKAKSLYKKVGVDLSKNVILAIQKTGKKLNGVVVTGGMVYAKEFWQKEFLEELNKKFQDVKVYYLANGIEVATHDLAYKMLKGE